MSRLEFSEKYDARHARYYLDKHQAGFWRRLNTSREESMLRGALQLAGNPAEVLDLPSGTGRFWSLLAELPGRTIIAADNSLDMVATGVRHRPEEISKRVLPIQGSAFAIPLAENAVDCVFCIRLLHHVGESADRLTMFREMARVARRSICVSLWVDGNYKAWRRRSHERRRRKHAYQNRFVIPRNTIESEFAAAGLSLTGHVDFLKYYSMWRTYVLSTE